MKNRISVFLFVVFLLFLGVFIFFLVRFVYQKPVPETKDAAPEQLILQQYPTINKSALPGGEGFYYELEGVLVEKLKFEDGAVQGRFVLRDDQRGRDFKIFLPQSMNEEVYFGVYDDSFQGSSKWKYVSRDSVIQNVQAGEPVKVTARFLTEVLENDEKVSEWQEMLDELLNDVVGPNNRKIDFSTEFTFMADGIAVIR